MLAVTSYAPAYVAQCVEVVDRQVAAYRGLAAAAGTAALAEFSVDFWRNMVLAMDHMFMHRLRNAELKDGNPLNEVRMLSDSIMEHGGVLQANKTIKYNPAKSVTGIAVGQAIVLDADTFERLSAAFFEDIAKKYP